MIFSWSPLSAIDLHQAHRELMERLEREQFTGSLVGLAENFPIYRNWEQVSVLTKLIENDPKTAANLATNTEVPLENRIALAYVASTLPPVEFVQFWEGISETEELSINDTKLVEYGLHLQGGSNLFTLSFNYTTPRIVRLLTRLVALVDGNARATKIVNHIATGQFRDGQLHEFSKHGPKDWKKKIPKLTENAQGLLGVVQTVDSSAPHILPESTPDKASTPGVIYQESPQRSPVWPYALVAVALIGIVAVLVRTRKGTGNPWLR
jgi:hypothetical protein